MPHMIPVVGALFTGTGLFAAGGAISVGLGGGLIGGAIAGALGGALVGAAIGGLTSLVMGGDIGKGILFGAIGGAVTGGIGGFMDAQAFQAASMSETYTSGAAGSMFKEGSVLKSLGESGGVMESAAAPVAGKAIEGGLVGKLGEAGTSALIEGGIGFVGSTMAGMAEEERWQAEMDAQIAEAEKSRQHEMEMLQAKLSADSSSSGSSSDRDWAAELAENRRQFNAELSQRKEEFAGTMGIRKQELYAPMEYQTEARERAGSALASVSVNRGEYKQGDSINKQVQAATEYPDPVIPAQPEVA